MKNRSLLTLLLLAALAVPINLSAFAQTRVRSYTKRDGTRVESHRRTKPNNTERDNWSTKGNTNPDTGKRGTKTQRR